MMSILSAAPVCNSASGLKYRREIVLNPAAAHCNHVVLVMLTPDIMGHPYRHIAENGADLRFMEADGKSNLNYWIESWNNTGISKIWVQARNARTSKIYMCYGNPGAKSCSDGTNVFDFFDDFNDGIWTKYAGNPIMTGTEPWEARAICEPSVIFEDGIFKIWYMGCKTSEGYNAA